MSWQLLTAINVITGSAVIPLQRLLLHRHKNDPIAFVIVSQLLTALLIVPYAFVHGFHMPDLSIYWLIILAMFALYSAGHILYAYTLRQVEASIFSTLLNSNIIWIILTGFVVFHEQAHLRDLLGTLLILASIGMLAEHSGKFKIDKSIWMGLLVGLVFGLAASMWVYIGRHSDVVTWTALSFAGTPLVILLIKPKSIRKMKPFLDNKMLIRMFLLAIFWAISNLASLAAYQRGNLSIIAPLQKTSVVVTVLLAILFLREKTRLWQKTLAAVICFAGVILIIR